MSEPRPEPPSPFDLLGQGALGQMLEEGTDGVWCYDPEEDRVLWSPRLLQTLDQDRAPGSLAEVQDLVHSDDREPHRLAVEHTLTSGSPHLCSLRLRCGDGSYRWLSVRGLPVPKAGGGSLLFGFVLDDSEARQARADLARSEARFRAFMDNCPAAVFLKRFDGPHLYVNKQAAQIAGTTVEAMTGRTTAELFPEKIAAQLLDADREALQSRQPVSWSGWVGARSDAERYVLDVKFRVPDMKSDENLIGGFGLDITDRIQQEEEMRRLDRRMQDKKRLESLGMLAGGVAHDFNNILLSIVGNAELALGEDDPARREHSLTRIIERSQHAAKLCSQLLLYAGRTQSRPRAVSPAELLTASEELHDLARHSGSRLQVDVEDDLPSIWVDPTQMRQVLLNLVVNGAQAMAPAGGGALRVECRASELPLADSGPGWHSWYEGGPAVCFRIADEGPGMNAEQLQRAFEPFYSTKRDGHGLGLSTVLGIVQAHHGAIHTTSVEGEGTTLDVWMPVARPGAEVGSLATPEPRASSTDLQGWRVLLVDDQPDVREVAGMMLQRMGAEVVSERSGADALAAFDRQGAKERFDLALLDLRMPGMGGCELAEALRQRDPALVIVLSSGYPQEAGGHEFPVLEKPYTMGGLRESLLAALQSKDRL